MADPSAPVPPLGDPLSPEATAAIAAFAAEDPIPLSDLLKSLKVDVERLWRLPRWNDESGGGEPGVADPGDQPPQSDRDERDTVLGDALLALREEPAGGALLALHVWNLCAEEWEHTYRFDRMLGTLRAFADLWDRDRRDAGDPDTRAAGDAGAALALLQILEIDAESAMCRGDLPRQAAAAADTLRAGEELLSASAAMSGRFAPLRAYFQALAQARIAYYRALCGAVGSAAEALRGRLDPLADGIRALARAERSDELSPIERSELRAHRFSLERIAAAADEEWLTVDRAEVTFVIPFGLNGRPPMEVVEALRGMDGPPVIAGVQGRAIRQSFQLDDVWAGADYLERRFEGAAVELPPVRLRHLDGAPIAEFTAELRLSQLGNHYLRLDSEVRDADPHEMQMALFRAEHGHGRIAVECGGRTWDRLADFAADFQAGVARRLSGQGEVTARPGRYQVLVALHELSAGTGPGAPARERRPVTSGGDLLGLFGAQALLHPVANGIGSVCDWSRYAVDASQLLHDVRKRGDLVAATENTTVIALFGSPSFMIGTYRTLAEFVGSLDGLFSAWHDRLASHHPRVTHLVGETTDERSVEALGAYSERLHVEQLLLHDFATETRSVLSLIHSPNLVTSPTDAAALSVLLRAAEVEQLELDFATKLRELLSDRIEVRIDAMATKLQQRFEADRVRQERFNRGVVDALLAAIAVFGAAGVVQILQAAGLTQPAFAAWAVAAILVMAAVCSVAVFRWSRSAATPDE
ncbi:hypothetical protein SAMN05216298_3110 [Glycomyces sambucus]|uniref:Uncharacterized protein n=1 Tax=Glycomyces sambucus TaxID=380244 RepID=A0A1G9I9S5_9ACTN|nr:hypothetical protein [Glycomyces sambucus]SDL21852.1 hypothetical protein SAMN05216298_3110 [Glycomyces sambucus]